MTLRTSRRKYVSGRTAAIARRNAGVGMRREERPADERHRQVDRVHDRGGALGALDHRGQADPEPAERDRAEDQRERERQRPARKADREEEPAEHEEADHLQGEGREERAQERDQVDGCRERSRSEPLQDAGLAPDHDHDREPGEGDRDRAVADHPGLQERGRADVALALDPVVAVHRGEQQEEDHRQQEREERELPAAHVEQQLALELVPEEPHSACSSVSDR